MLHLKNRNQGIPGGVQFVQPEANWDSTQIPGLNGASFNTVKNALIGLRRGNPWLQKKHNWAIDDESVGNELEHYNALRMQANPKWHHFVGADDGGASFGVPFQFPSGSVRASVAAVKKTVAGVGVLLRWLGSSGRSAPKPLAEDRASTCTVCPKNQQGDWKTWFTEEASREVLAVFGIMQDLKLSTSKDDQLGVCSACLCPLKSKVWAELRHIVAELSPEVKAQLNQENPKCWILSEMQSTND